MPSRKKAKGKARRAAKEAAKEAAKAKSKEEENTEVAATNNQQQEGSLEAQMKMLQIIKSQSSQITCTHGSLVSSLSLASLPNGDLRLCKHFITAFLDVASSFLEERGGTRNAIIAAHEGTEEEFADVYSSKLEFVISELLCSGTQNILDERSKLPDSVYIEAMLVCYFEEWLAVSVRKSKAVINWSKIFELGVADDHTLVAYYRKRIPCSCLDKKYKAVKSVKKMGWCYNPSCSIPNQMAERCKMFCCARCGEVNYCSIYCQKANWGVHKEECERLSKTKAAFDFKQRV